MLEILALLIIIALISLIYDFLETYGGILLCSVICIFIVVVFYHYRKQKITKQNTEQSFQLPSTDEKKSTAPVVSPQKSSSVTEDYAKTIFLYHVRISPIKKQEQYPKYFQDYSIWNAPQYHRSLIQEGYLEEAPLKDRLQSLKLSELKAILEEQGLGKSGKKRY